MAVSLVVVCSRIVHKAPLPVKGRLRPARAGALSAPRPSSQVLPGHAHQQRQHGHLPARAAASASISAARMPAAAWSGPPGSRRSSLSMDMARGKKQSDFPEEIGLLSMLSMQRYQHIALVD